MENYLIEIIIAMALLEIFEASWQRAATVEGMLYNSYQLYKKSIFLLFLMHPTFYFVLFVSLATQTLNFGIVTILTLKSIDLIFKVDIIKKHFVDNNLNRAFEGILKSRMEPWVYMMGLLLYLPILFLALI
ncbi:MAG: hypothetical protein KU38_04695 [Sulfurovum sp. FS08-3]|nr:MAG: hypothetical protein KU38_04695 [Sulfurovum sp. FS08-3]